MTQPRDPVARILRQRQLALESARRTLAARLVSLAAAEATANRLSAVAAEVADAVPPASGGALAAAVAAGDRLARAREATENRRRTAERQSADAQRDYALALAALEVTERLRDERVKAASRDAVRKSGIGIEALARPLLRLRRTR